MYETLILFETAKLAKEKKFNWDIVDFYYDDGRLAPTYDDKKTDSDYNNWPKLYSAPTQSLLQKWLREMYNIFILILRVNKNGNRMFTYTLGHIEDASWDVYKTYEGALEAGLQEALKLIKL